MIVFSVMLEVSLKFAWRSNNPKCALVGWFTLREVSQAKWLKLLVFTVYGFPTVLRGERGGPEGPGLLLKKIHESLHLG